MDTRSEVALAAPAAAAPADLAGRARLAVAWATGFQFFRDVVQFGLTMTLVRLLPAEAYGQFGFVTTLLSFFTLYSFREFLGHTLQVRDGETVHYQDHFTAGAVLQLGVTLVVNLVAVGLRWLPEYAAVSTVLHVMSILFLIDLPAEFRARMLERALDWRRLRTLQALGFLAGGVASIILALSGAGAYALLLPTLLVPLPFVYDLFVTERWRPTWAFSRERFRPSWNFGTTRIATVTMVALATLAESSWLAGALGFAVLGIFGRAMGLAQLLCGRIAGLLALSIYPVLTRLQPETEAFRRAAALYLRSIGWVTMPAAVLAGMLATPLVQVVYGHRWLDAIPLVPWAMGAAAIAALVQTAYTLLLANGRQRECLAADAWRLAGTLLALTLFLPTGPAAYLAAVCVLHVVSLAMIIGFLWRRNAVTVSAVREAVLPPVLSVAVAGVTTVALLGGPPGEWSVLRAMAQAGLFSLVYLVVLRSAFAAPLGELVGYLPQSVRLRRLLRLAPRTA